MEQGIFNNEKGCLLGFLFIKIISLLKVFFQITLKSR